MLRDIINAWRSKGFMEKLLNEFLHMLADAAWMFQKCSKAIFEETVPESLQEEIYVRDIRVNQEERQIRKELLTHLVMRPKGDVPACLILMSICKDAERLGDYTKNLFEVRAIAGGALAGELAEEIRALCEEAVDLFARTERAFGESDEALAKSILERESSLGKEAEALVRRIAQSDLPVSQAVAKAMAARFVKRVFAHLGNIASSVVMPVHKLDYFDENWLRGDKR